MVDNQVIIKPSNRFSIKALRQFQPCKEGLNLQQRADLSFRRRREKQYKHAAEADVVPEPGGTHKASQLKPSKRAHKIGTRFGREAFQNRSEQSMHLLQSMPTNSYTVYSQQMINAKDIK